MKKTIKYGLLIVLPAFALYHSVNLQPLDQVLQSRTEGTYNPSAYAIEFMTSRVEALPALNASAFLAELTASPEQLCELKGKKLGISDAYNFIIEGEATIKAVEEEFTVVTLANGQELKIATSFIFGNAIRDGSGMAHIGDFQNTMDFNAISVELNNIVRETIVPPFRENAEPGQQLYFKGAVKVDITNPETKTLRIMPVQIKMTE